MPRFVSRSLSPRTSLLAAALVAVGGCYDVEEPDAGPPAAKDGGTIDLTRDAGPEVRPDAGPPPVDSGPPPVEDAGPPAVQILSFGADSETLAFLSGTTLRWNTVNAASCAIAPDIGTVGLPSGSRFVDAGAPGDSVSYTLTCQGGGGPVSESVTVITALVEHQGDYSANTEGELASLASINIVTGNLRIENVAGVTDLSVLEGLVRVDGHLFVLTNPALTSVDLPNLEDIGLSLFVDGNPALSGFDLPALDSIGERFYSSRNPLLPQSEIDDVVAQVSAAEGILGPVVDYYNDPAAVLTSLNQLMVCTTDGVSPAYDLDFHADGSVLAFNRGTSQLYAGTYSRFEGQLEIEFPGVTGELTASLTELEYDRVTRVVFPSDPGECFLSGLPGTGFAATTRYRCPTGGGPERMDVELGPDGAAWWTNAPTSGAGETLTFPGAYVVEGAWLYFAFPASIRTDSAPTLRFPIARRSVDGSSLDFPELPDGTSPCPAE